MLPGMPRHHKKGQQHLMEVGHGQQGQHSGLILSLPTQDQQAAVVKGVMGDEDEVLNGGCR